jgi:hypothetical protein
MYHGVLRCVVAVVVQQFFFFFLNGSISRLTPHATFPAASSSKRNEQHSTVDCHVTTLPASGSLLHGAGAQITPFWQPASGSSNGLSKWALQWALQMGSQIIGCRFHSFFLSKSELRFEWVVVLSGVLSSALLGPVFLKMLS